MSEFARNDGSAKPTVAEAKSRLLALGEEQSRRAEAMAAKVREDVRGVTPWLAGAAAVMGVVMGRRGRGSKRRAGEPIDTEPRAHSGAFDMLTWALRVGGPVMFEVLRGMRDKRRPSE